MSHIVLINIVCTLNMYPCHGVLHVYIVFIIYLTFKPDNLNNEMSKSKINLLSWMCVLSYSLFVCTSAYANVYFQATFNQHSCVRGPLWGCRSIRSGASGLPYYCTPPVCVPAVLGLLAVWRHNKPKTQNQDKWSASGNSCVGGWMVSRIPLNHGRL